MFQNISESIEDTKDRLSELDGAIGDADHGITMSIGFQAVKSELGRRDLEGLAPPEVMNLAATAFFQGGATALGTYVHRRKDSSPQARAELEEALRKIRR